MTVDEFLAWAEGQPGRYELYHGRVYAMSPERVGHAAMKFRVARALDDGIRRGGLGCHMLPDGATVRVDPDTAHEPDALVYRGPKLPRDVLEVPDPVIVVEVLSPATRRIDAAAKFAGYFRVPSVRHYLMIDPDNPPVIHHHRRDDGSILSRIVADGVIELDPPGLEINLAELYPA